MLSFALVLIIISSGVNLNRLPTISKPQNPHLQNNFQNVCWGKNHLLFLFSVILTQHSVTLGEILSGEVVADVCLDGTFLAVPRRSWLDSGRKSCGRDPAPKSGSRYGAFLFPVFS